MNVNRYEGLSRELSLTVPLLDVTLIVLVLLLLAGPVPGGSEPPKLTVTDQTPIPPSRTLELRSDGAFYYRGNRLRVEKLPDTLTTTGGESVALLIGPDTDFATIKQALRKLNQAGLSPEVRILVPPK